MADSDIKSLGSFVWSIAELLRGDLKQSEYGKVVLPFVVLRRLDCILAPTKDAVVSLAEDLPDDLDDYTRDLMLSEAAGDGIRTYNTSSLTFRAMRQQQAGDIHKNLVAYITSFSPGVRDIFLDKFLFTDQLKRLNDAGILWQVFERFAQIDLHPKSVSSTEMGYLFEDLIRRFSEISNETAGEHFTPREVIRLIVKLVTDRDADALTGSGIIRQVYDPACGTGGMLALTEEHLRQLNDRVRVELYGQELNPESYAICKSDMLVTGHDPENIAFGNTLTQDAHKERSYHYMLSNPPYGVDWKKYQDPIREEAEALGHDGRFGAGLPRISDGQLLFLQHMISKMRDDDAGSRIGIVMNGSPLFTGGAGSGESEIRRWMLENDLVEAIISLPTDLFYNTGIQTYVWLLSNRKEQKRRGKVQLIDASGERFWRAMRKSLGSKRREISEEAIDEVARIYGDMLNGDGDWAEVSKIFQTTDFGYREIRVERPLRLRFEITKEAIERLRDQKPIQKLNAATAEALWAAILSNMNGQVWTDRVPFLKALDKALKAADLKVGAPVKKAIVAALGERDEEAEICRDKDGNPESDTGLRDHELVPLDQDWRDYVAREVTPFVPDAWVDESHRDAADRGVGRVGYEINFNRYFYQYVPPRPLEEIDTELRALEVEIAGLLKEVVE
ncbi:type I restriction-modification system subunit M [Jannaschia rubra]|uniref:site-specific DNA-methyltransferase (adenine-specific) n=1 Tax=Jannaschia rubra TaxID=282197 RepID=A0A0M6XS56_9RHOB|nr:class I SAM-dependent DNA methyltransferase [Jannaschia rubra]CTQ33930.1 Type I restriction enzyme EcoKI M protein [Jannaschia rubra]SFG76414.1 type I restriction enzyme M protein [Jannaschia rubra]